MIDVAIIARSGKIALLATGLISIGVVLSLSALLIVLLGASHLTDWIATAFMSAIPMQIIVSLVWNHAEPAFVRSLRQPLKGVALTAVIAAAGMIVFNFAFVSVGGGHGVTPMLTHFMIMTVVVTLWLVLIWQCWPFTLLTGSRSMVGMLTLLSCYALAYALWALCFDYSELRHIGKPLYYADIDPSGRFDMWAALVFALTTGATVMTLGLFDFWPIDTLPGASRQPVRGVIGTALVLMIAATVRWLFVGVIGMQQVEYMVRVPVCVAFGVLIVSNIMQFSLFSGMAQPRRGLALLVLAAVIAVASFWLYGLAAIFLNGFELGMGPANGFAREVWIASAMLGVTFPVIFIVSGFFEFWPVKRS